MKIKQIASAAALCLGTALSFSASATTLTNVQSSFSPWGGFDWEQGGTAFTSNFTGVVGDSFTLTVFAVAGSLNKEPTGTFIGAALDSNADGSPEAMYEYTLVATITEKIESCESATKCTFSITSGAFDIYYDTAQNATSNALSSLGTGYLDGIKIISGLFGAQAGGTFDSAGTGSNSTTVQGTVTTTNASYINPELLTTTATTTLQLGSAVTGWVNPGGFNGVGFGENDIVLQADANQNFTSRVPEPGTLSLIALALLGGGAAGSRRRKAQK